jgi:hypothetical protein
MLAGLQNRDTMLKVCIEFRKTCRTLGLGCDFIRHFKESTDSDEAMFANN